MAAEPPEDTTTNAAAVASDRTSTATSSFFSLSDPEKEASSPTTTINNVVPILSPSSSSSSSSDDEPPENPLSLHATTATTQTIDFPEGGLEAWLVVLGAFCAMLSLFGLINSAAVFESYFASHQLADRTASEIGWIFSLYLFIVFFVGIQVGPVFDRFGSRVLVAVGGGLIFVSLLVLGWCEGTFFFFSCLFS